MSLDTRPDSEWKRLWHAKMEVVTETGYRLHYDGDTNTITFSAKDEDIEEHVRFIDGLLAELNAECEENEKRAEQHREEVREKAEEEGREQAEIQKRLDSL